MTHQSDQQTHIDDVEEATPHLASDVKSWHGDETQTLHAKEIRRASTLDVLPREVNDGTANIASGALSTPEPEFHPIAGLFPLIEGEDFARLVPDIKEHGLREPILLTPDGLVLDGRNRLRACQEADVTPRFETTTEPPENWLDLVISNNIRRRHLTASQRAAIAAELVTTKLGDNHFTPRSEKFPTITQAQAAVAVGASDRSVRDALKVKEVSDLLFKRVKTGKVSVDVAADVARDTGSRPSDIADFTELLDGGMAPTKAKRAMEAKKKSARHDELASEKGVPTSEEKSATDLAPNPAEEFVDFFLERTASEDIPTVNTFVEATKPKEFFAVLRRKLRAMTTIDEAPRDGKMRAVTPGKAKRTKRPNSRNL